MSSPSKEIHEALASACLDAGCEDWQIEHGSKHDKVRLYRGSCQRTVTISRTPSCKFAVKKMKRNVCHALKELGYGGS